MSFFGNSNYDNKTLCYLGSAEMEPYTYIWYYNPSEGWVYTHLGCLPSVLGREVDVLLCLSEGIGAHHRLPRRVLGSYIKHYKHCSVSCSDPGISCIFAEIIPDQLLSIFSKILLYYSRIPLVGNLFLNNQIVSQSLLHGMCLHYGRYE